jgi:hypothetical protein
MRVALARRYRIWMLLLLPVTLGLGTLVLWLRSLKWPRRIDDCGITLRCRYRLDWGSIKRIGLSRSYVDGHCAEIRIHHAWGTSKVPVDDLQDGETVVQVMVEKFELARTRRRHGKHQIASTSPDQERGSTQRGSAHRRRSIGGTRAIVVEMEPEHMEPDWAAPDALSEEFEMLEHALRQHANQSNGAIYELQEGP